ncbi:TPA: hypothetical protein ACGORU_001955 [Streptococcus suis]
MGRFFIGREYHDAMYGDDGRLVPGLGHKSKEELERLSHSLFDAGWPSVKHKFLAAMIVIAFLLFVLIAIIMGAWETYKKHEQKNQEEKS